MKKIIIILVWLLTISVSLANDKPRPFVQLRVRELNEKIELLELQVYGFNNLLKEKETRIKTLEVVIQGQKKEIKRLKNLCHTAGLEMEPTEDADKNKKIVTKPPNKIEELNKPIFGIYLGESLDSLKKRMPLNAMDSCFDDKDNPTRMWYIKNSDLNTKMIGVFSFEGRIYLIAIYLADASQTNFNVIKKQLEQKYANKEEGLLDTLSGEVTFNPAIDGVPVSIRLNRDDKIFDDDTLTLSYYHLPLLQRLETEVERRKAAKVSEKL